MFCHKSRNCDKIIDLRVLKTSSLAKIKFKYNKFLNYYPVSNSLKPETSPSIRLKRELKL